jgi:hypothetical protein
VSDFDDERERARAAILKRRAKLVAYAVAAGVAMPACGGKASGDPGGEDTTGGAKNLGGYGTSGSGPTYCLSAPGGRYGGGTGGVSVCLSVCLGMPYAGEGGIVCLSGGAPPFGGNAGEGGASEGGAAGSPPIYCLSAPLAGAPPVDGGAGNGDGPNNGGAASD